MNIQSCFEFEKYSSDISNKIFKISKILEIFYYFSKPWKTKYISKYISSFRNLLWFLNKKVEISKFLGISQIYILSEILDLSFDFKTISQTIQTCEIYI